MHLGGNRRWVPLSDPRSNSPLVFFIQMKQNPLTMLPRAQKTSLSYQTSFLTSILCCTVKLKVRPGDC